MTNLKLATLTSAVALAACVTAFDSANAQPQGAVYGGGSTLASKVYRQLMDCWGIPVNPTVFPISTSCPSPTGRVVAGSSQILYSPVGSGAGKRALEHHSGSTLTTIGLGVPATSNTVPYTSSLLSSYGYPGFHFAGSDDILTQSDLTTYANASGPAQFGAILEIPAFVTPIAIPFNGKDGNGNPLTINPANFNPTGSTSKLDLSRQAYCGIFTGHITKWDNPILTALNGGTVLGHGQISVVHRSDGSGTTFLTTNGLVAQCGYAILNGPNNETDPTVVSYAFAYTDRNGGTNDSNPPPVEGSDLVNWPDLSTDQFGNAIPTPAGSVYINASGSAGVTNLVASTAGAIGYVSPDFVQPVVASAPATANLQDYNDIVSSTGQFWAPTAANATTAMNAANYNMTITSMTDPLLWSSQGVQPDPTIASAYPLSGFTWLDFYQCYEPTNGALIDLTAYLQWFYTDPNAQAILGNNGFAPIPAPWFNDAAVLVVVSSHSLAYPGGGTCSAVSPPGA